MHYYNGVRVSMRGCVPSIVIMESGEDTRVVFIRVCDTCAFARLRQLVSHASIMWGCVGLG